MKTIEERAENYASQRHVLMNSTNRAAYYGYIAGAYSEREELLRWHDPEDPPTHENEVLVKYICGTGGCEFCIVAYYSNGEWQAPNNMLDEYDTILGWREIHE